jgi:hypothetical protein
MRRDQIAANGTDANLQAIITEIVSSIEFTNQLR